MRKKITVVLGMLMILSSCKHEPEPPLSDLIEGKWTTKRVKEESVAVFDNNSTNNLKSYYKNFSMSFDANMKATVTEVDNVAFIGQYQLNESDKTLNIYGLNPIPSQSNGSLNYKILSLSDSEMILNRESLSLKTGAIQTEYTLIKLK